MKTLKRGARLRTLHAALLGCTTLASPVTVWAQDAVNIGQINVDATVSDNDADSVVATTTQAGSKLPTAILDTPASVSVITAKELQERGASTIEQALEYTPGVVTHFYGSDDRFDYYRIRGFDAYAYRDGLALGRAFGGAREEPFAFERIEVVKGANSTVSGVSDPGGSVNYVSKRPRDTRFGETYVTGGSFNRREVGFDFGDNLTKDSTLSYRLTGKVQNADKEYDYSKDDERFLMGGLTWRPSDYTTLTVVADYLKRDSTPGSGGHPLGIDLDRSVFLGEPDYNYRGTDRKSISAMLDHDFGIGLSLHSALRYSKTKTDFGYAYVYDAAPVGTRVNRYFFGNDSSAERTIGDVHLQYDKGFGTIQSRTVVGLEAWKMTSTQDSYSGAAPSIDWTNPVYSGRPASVPLYSSQKIDQSGTGAYVQEELTFNERLIATLGLRHDKMDIKQTNRLRDTTSDNDISENTHRAALTYKITPDLSVYGSYAESVVPATVNADPERGKQKEVGIKFSPEGMRALFSASVYDLEKTNITVTNPVTEQQEAIGKVRVRGLELEARAEVTDALSIIAGYSHLKSKIVENGTGGFEGNRISFVPDTEASLWATYKVDANGSFGAQTFGVGARYTGAYYFDNANTLKTGGSTTFDASYVYNVRENTAVQVNISNLFDKKALAYGGYGADWYNTGRTFAVTLRQTW